MPLLQINAFGSSPKLSGAIPPEQSLSTLIAALPPGAPIILLIHGYQFSPFHIGRDPHDHILSLTPPPLNGVLSWPRQLGFGHGHPQEGLCVAFGWRAHGTIWRAYREAEDAGHALAELLHEIKTLTRQPVDILSHSLGARVALTGVAQAARGNVGRVIMMAAAEFRGPAEGSLGSPAGQKAEFINIASRENDFFDLLIERALHPFARSPRALGDGLATEYQNWLDIQIDHDATRAALAGFGHRIPAATRRVCHWSGYLRPGMFMFYNNLIRDRERLTLARLKSALPRAHDPRWSRLFGPGCLPIPLPLPPKASS